MKVYKNLRKEHVLLDVSLRSKDDVFLFVAETFARDGVVENSHMLYESMKQREATMSTGIGNGIGIPHATSWEAETPAVMLVRLADPIDFEALDALPVSVILALVIPENQTSLHLQLLAGISRLCKKTKFLDLVRAADNSRDLWEGVKRLEQEMAFH